MHVYFPRIRHWQIFCLISKYPPIYIFGKRLYLFSRNYLHLIQKYLMKEFHTESYIWHLKNRPITAALIHTESYIWHLKNGPITAAHLYMPELQNIVIILSLNALQGTWKYRASVPPSVRSCWHSHVYNSCQIFIKGL